MKRWIILVIFCPIIFYQFLFFADFSDKVIENTKSAIVALYTDENLNYFRASGFFINSSGVVITAKHVVRDHLKLWARLYNGRKLELTLNRFQEDDDLAIMLPKVSKNESFNFPYLKFSDINKLAVGQPVMSIGNSINGLWQVVYGDIENMYKNIIVEDDVNLNMVKFKSIIEHSSIMPKGFSGSPLVDEKGEVLGMNIAISKFSSDRNSSYAINLGMIRSFVEEFNRKNHK